MKGISHAVNLPISLTVTLLALWQSHDDHCAKEVALKKLDLFDMY